MSATGCMWMSHAKAIDMVQENGRLGETYNVGGHNEKQNIEIINIINR